MAESNVCLPDDTANTGKKLRTCTFTVGADTVHARYDVLLDDAGTKLVFASTDPATNAAGLPVRLIAPATPAAVTVSGTPTASITNFPGSFNVGNFPGSQAVTGPLTDTQLRATAVPVSLASVPSHAVTGPLTNTELRASAVPVSMASGTVSATIVGTVPVSGTFWQATQPVSGPLTDTQLRASAVPVSGTLSVTGGAQDATLTGGTAKSILRGGAKGTTAAADVTSVAVDANTQAVHTSVTNWPTSQTINGSVAISGGALSISAGTVTLGTSASVIGSAVARGGAKGSTTAADVTSTASGANHNALDVIQYDAAGNIVDPRSTRALTTADAVNVGQWVGSAAPTVGQKAMASSLPVTVASDQAAFPVYDRPPSLAVSGTAAAAATLTLTLPAVAGQFHYIGLVEATLYTTAARTGAATPILSTATNAAGLGGMIFPTAGAVGVVDRQVFAPTNPLKSTAVNTATVINFPAVTGGFWAARVIYFPAA